MRPGRSWTMATDSRAWEMILQHEIITWRLTGRDSLYQLISDRVFSIAELRALLAQEARRIRAARRTELTLNRNGLSLATLGEVAQACEGFEHLRCAPSVEEDDGIVTVVIRFHAADVGQAEDTLALMGLLQRVVDAAQLRGFSAKYGIPSDLVERVLDERKED